MEMPPPTAVIDDDQPLEEMNVASEIDVTTTDEVQEGAKESSTQTECEMTDKEVETCDLPRSKDEPVLSIHNLKDKPNAVLHFTGFESYEHFIYLFQCLGPAANNLSYKSTSLDAFDELFLCLVKLRKDSEDEELAVLFGLSRPVVSRLFNTWLNFLYFQLRELEIFLPREVIDEHMPSDFKAKYPETRIILDATEVKIQAPSKVEDQKCTWSSYKNSNTLKSMVGISPRGVVTYVSPAYGGSASDRQIIEASPLLHDHLFAPGDSIMADRGIRVQDLFASQDVKVNTPTPLSGGRTQLAAETVVKDRRIASKRIHVERLIGLAKTFKILKNTLDHSKTPLGSRIMYVCFVLCNFKKSIVRNSC